MSAQGPGTTPLDLTPSDDARIDELNKIGFNHVIGLSLVRWSEDDCLIRLQISPQHLNPAGLVHGGVFSTMLDVVLAMTGSYSPPPLVLMPGLTLNLNTQFISAATTEDKEVFATARKTGGGRTVFFASGEVVTEQGRLIASATGTFKPGRQPTS